MKDNIAVVGIDIGGTKISAALFRHDGKVLQKEIRPVDGRKGNEVVELIIDLVRGLISFAKNTSFNVVAIGACVPGIYNPVKKTVWAPNIPNWDNYPLWQELNDRLNSPSIIIVIESDRSCYILGEVWKGSAQGCSDAIFISVGTGIGAGILSNGRIITGSSGIAGAIGWMALESPYETKYNDYGNFEYYASGNGIARSAREALRKSGRPTSILDDIPVHELTSHHIFKALKKKDPVAVEVVQKAVRYWGMAVANLVSIFNPEKVIFGGGVFGPAGVLLDKILEESKKWSQPLAILEISLEVTTLDGDAGLIGAGYLAINRLNDQAYDK